MVLNCSGSLMDQGSCNLILTLWHQQQRNETEHQQSTATNSIQDMTTMQIALGGFRTNAFSRNPWSEERFTGCTKCETCVFLCITSSINTLICIFSWRETHSVLKLENIEYNQSPRFFCSSFYTCVGLKNLLPNAYAIHKLIMISMNIV